MSVTVSLVGFIYDIEVTNVHFPLITVSVTVSLVGFIYDIEVTNVHFPLITVSVTVSLVGFIRYFLVFGCAGFMSENRVVSASASAQILDTPRLGITSRHAMVRLVHDQMLCPYMYSAG